MSTTLDVALRGARDTFSFKVNGDEITVTSGDITPKTVLAQFLRDRGLTGTKVGCGQGGCGACTVMLTAWDLTLEKTVHRKINACLTPVFSLEGCHVTTVEGLVKVHDDLHGEEHLSLDPGDPEGV